MLIVASEAPFSLGLRVVVGMTDNFTVTGKAARRRGLGNEIGLNGPVADEAFHHRLAVLAGLPVREFVAVAIGTLLGRGHIRVRAAFLCFRNLFGG